MFPYSNKKSINHHKEAGMTLVVTLLLMLTLTIMASAITFVVNDHADTTNTVTHKPVAIESADACIEEAIAWAQTTEGETWLGGTEVTGIDSLGYGIGAVTDIGAPGGILHSKNLKLHTQKKSGDTRAIYFKDRLEKASCTSVRMTVVKKTAGEVPEATGVGSEIGSESFYGSGTVAVIPYKYEVLVVAEGIFNVATKEESGTVVIDRANWVPNSNKSKVEVLFSYQQ